MIKSAINWIAAVFAIMSCSPALAVVIDSQNFDHILGDWDSMTTEDSFIGSGVLTNRGSYNYGSGLDGFLTSWVDTNGYISAGPADVDRLDSFDIIGVYERRASPSGDSLPDIGADGRLYGPDQNHSYTIGGPDGAVTVSFLLVDLTGYANASLTLSYYVNVSKGWTSGRSVFEIAVNGEERLRMDNAALGAASSPDGVDEVVWHTFTTGLDGLDVVMLSVMLDAGGSNSKRIVIDDIFVTGDVVSSVPAPFALPLLATGLGLLMIFRRR